MVKNAVVSPAAALAATTLPGLVWGCRFDAEGSGRFLAEAELLAGLTAEDGWLWLHFNAADLRGRSFLGDTDLLSDEASQTLLDDDEHLSLTAADATLMGVFADFRRDFDHGTHDLARLRFALHERLLVTARRHPLHAVETVRHHLIQGRRFETGPQLLEAIFETFVDETAAMARELAARLETYEDRIVEDRVSERDVQIGPMRRTMLRLNRQLSTLRLHFSAFVDGEDREVPDDVFAMVERVSLRLATVGRDIEAMQERARIVQEELSTKLANAANRQLYAISVLTALFLPATFVTGLFGMNTHGLPFDDSSNGFWQAFAVGMTGSALVYLVLRWLERRQ